MLRDFTYSLPEAYKEVLKFFGLNVQNDMSSYPVLKFELLSPDNFIWAIGGLNHLVMVVSDIEGDLPNADFIHKWLHSIPTVSVNRCISEDGSAIYRDNFDYVALYKLTGYAPLEDNSLEIFTRRQHAA